MRGKQLSFLPKIKLQHGGDTAKGKRKIRRPYDRKRPMHVTMRALKARGRLSMQHPSNSGLVHVTVYATAAKYGVKLYRYANVGNHLHFLLQTRQKRDLQRFLREVAGKVAFAITGAKKGNPVGKFWDMLAWSRIVEWGRDFARTDAYVAKNILEGFGIPRYMTANLVAPGG